MQKIIINRLITAVIILLCAVLLIALSLFFISQRHLLPKSISNITSKVNQNEKIVTKIIDGDTVIIEGGDSVRLLGMDADERDYPCYDVAKQRLEELVLGKKVILESDTEDKDMYGRYLRYLILDGKNIDLELVKEGLAVARFSSDSEKYKEEITTAEQEAMKNKIGCKWSGRFQALNQSEEKPIENLKWVKLSGESIDACEAKNYIGQEKIVEGKIVDSNKTKTNTVFLNFSKLYPNQCFTAVIFSGNLKNFQENPQNYYKDKTVRVRGLIKNYQGKPEIILNNQNQIEIGE